MINRGASPMWQHAICSMQFLTESGMQDRVTTLLCDDPALVRKSVVSLLTRTFYCGRFRNVGFHDCAKNLVVPTVSGRNHAKAAAVDRNVTRERTGAVCHGVARDELFRLWECRVKTRGLAVPNPTNALDGALIIRCDLADQLLLAVPNCCNPRSAGE